MNVGSLSVIMCNYNHACYIGDALQAILNQTFMPIEVIVVDDGSTDNSITVIEQFTKRSSIVRLVRNDRNRGVVFSANRALDIASGDYMYFASADDKVLPGLFEKSMNLLAQYLQAGLCCSDPAWFDDRTSIIRETKLHWSDKPCYFSAEALAKVIKGGWIAGHTSIVKRAALLEAGGLIEGVRWHCDWFALLVIAFRYGICYIPEPLAMLRVHSNSYSASGRKHCPSQREVLNNLLHLLKSPAYRDVLPLFRRGRVMSHFGEEVVRVVLTNPEHWDIQSIMLIQNLVRTKARKIFRRILTLITPSPVKRAYRRVRVKR